MVQKVPPRKSTHRRVEVASPPLHHRTQARSTTRPFDPLTLTITTLGNLMLELKVNVKQLYRARSSCPPGPQGPAWREGAQRGGERTAQRMERLVSGTLFAPTQPPLKCPNDSTAARWARTCCPIEHSPPSCGLPARRWVGHTIRRLPPDAFHPSRPMCSLTSQRPDSNGQQ